MLTETQREERKKGLGGSDAAAVIGWSRWKTPYDIWRIKTQYVEEPTTEAMQRGIELEPHVRELYEKETGNKVNVVENILKHPKHNFIIANPDGIIADKNIGLEIKTTGSFSNMNLADLIDNKDWLCQVAHYAEVTKMSEYHLFVYHIESQQTKLYIYNPSESFQKALIGKESRFWNDFVVTNTPPPITKLEDIKKHFNKAENIQAIADEKTLTRIQRLIQLHKMQQHIKEEEELLKTDIFLEMATANELLDENGNRLATWKETPSNRFDTTAFKKDHPELFQQYFKTGKTRRFLPNYKLGE